MKTLISAVALVTTLSTPAFAEKTPVKPLSSCEEEIMLKQMIYHLDTIEMLIEEMRTEALRQYPKPIQGESLKKAG